MMSCRPLFLALFAVLIAPATGVRAAEGIGKGFPVRGGSAPRQVRTERDDAASRIRKYNPIHDAGFTPAPAPSPVPDLAPGGEAAFENNPIAFSENSRRKRSGAGERETAMPSIWPALLSVFAVCAVFCAILYLVKKYLPGHRQLFAHPAMEVLGRTHLDQRRYVSLLRVGKRIVVVGVSPDEMRPLSEITDEAEITAIMEVARPKTEAGLTVFQKLFKRNVQEAEAEATRLEAEAKAGEIGEQMRELRRQVRSIGGAAEREPMFETLG